MKNVFDKVYLALFLVVVILYIDDFISNKFIEECSFFDEHIVLAMFFQLTLGIMTFIQIIRYFPLIKMEK